MRQLKIMIEIEGQKRYAGDIGGETYRDACFQYAEEYLKAPYAAAISISLPLQKEPFSAGQTKCFFEGLLPEGFSRRAVANWAHVEENDYLSILEKLGQECLGAIQVQEKDTEMQAGDYLRLSAEQVKKLAAEGATKSTAVLMETHLSLTGASGKVGLYYDEPENDWYLPIGDAASTHIVKQSHVRLKQIVANEQLCFLIAKKMGIEVPETFIINLGHGEDDEVLFATRRYDRVTSDDCIHDLQKPWRLHQEDFCQAIGIPASEKYEKQPKGYMKRMFEILRNYSENPLEDQRKLWDIIVTNYFLGNTDCHLKNYSLLYSPDLKKIRLAPAYDLVCTVAYETTKEMSFYIGNDLLITALSRDSFRKAAKEAGLGENFAMRRYDLLLSKFEAAINEAAEELINQGYEGVEGIREVLRNRYNKLKNQ